MSRKRFKQPFKPWRCSSCCTDPARIRACEILGGCLKQHEIVKDDPVLKMQIGQAAGWKQIFKILDSNVKRRMIFSNGRAKPTIIIPKD